MGDADLLGVLSGRGGVTSIASEQTGGVAFWAHLGGFIAGVVLVNCSSAAIALPRTPRITGVRATPGVGGRLLWALVQFELSVTDRPHRGL